MVCGECCSILIAILCPPLGLCCYKGCGTQTCLCLCLTILCPYVGGLIYAIVVICQGPDQKQTVQVIIPHRTVYSPSSAPPFNPTPLNISPYPSQPSAPMYGQEQFHYPHFPLQPPYPAEQPGFITPIALQPPSYSQLLPKSG